MTFRSRESSPFQHDISVPRKLFSNSIKSVSEVTPDKLIIIIIIIILIIIPETFQNTR